MAKVEIKMGEIGGGSSHEIGNTTVTLTQNVAVPLGIKSDDVGMVGVYISTYGFTCFFYNDSGTWVGKGNTNMSISDNNGYIEITSAYATISGDVFWG